MGKEDEEKKRVKGSFRLKETELEELADVEPHESLNQNGGESDETTPSDDIIKKLMPLAGSMGAALAGALLPGSLLGLSGSLLGASRLAPGVLNSLVSMLVGAGAYHSLANIVKDFPDLGAPRFEDAIFQILQSDHSPVGFFVKDLSNKYVYLNKSMLGFIGKPIAEVIGKTDAELFPEEEQTISARNF